MTPQQIPNGLRNQLDRAGRCDGTGTGQTIAIIDTYDDPALVSSTNPNFVNSDLYRFDHNPSINLPDPPSFLKLDENGGTNYPVPDPSAGPQGSWAMEEALDVQWAHAIAPQANIILFEASSASDQDLITTAVNTARNWPGVTAVSMSFGRPEEGSGIELGVDIGENPTFTTPSGHVGVTFLSSTGDTGTPGGFPAYSPNVVAVGGTTLTVDGNGNWQSETGWSLNGGWGGGGGQSQFETEPSYQLGVQTSGMRQIPVSRSTPIPPRAWPSATRMIWAALLPGYKWAAPASRRLAGPVWWPSPTNYASPPA